MCVFMQLCLFIENWVIRLADMWMKDDWIHLWKKLLNKEYIIVKFLRHIEWKYKIQLIKMKTLNQFDTDSHSTQERERRFSRKSKSKSPRALSNKSNEKSLSKFWVKQVNTSNLGQDIEGLLGKKVSPNPRALSPRRLNNAKASAEMSKRLLQEKLQLLEQKQKQNKKLSNEIEKYHIYARKHNEKFQAVKKQNEKLHEQNRKLQQNYTQILSNNGKLQREIEQLQGKILQKDVIIQNFQREQTTLQKIKSSIKQNRYQEFEEEKKELNKKIIELEEQLKQEKSLNESTKLSTSLRSMASLSLTHQDSAISEQTMNYENLLTQLYQSRNQIKKLKISQSCMQRKFFKDLEQVKAKKQKEYDDLKKKFTTFLQKYKANMKKAASIQLQSLHQKTSPRNQSTVSFNLSSDQEQDPITFI